MATYSKLGYGNAANLDTAITNGKIDGKDIVITKDTSEFYYIRDDKTKQAIRPRPAMYNSVSAAESDLAKNSDTFAGQTVMIRAEDGICALHCARQGRRRLPGGSPAWRRRFCLAGVLTF